MQQNPMIPDFSFLEEVQASGAFNLSECFQCRKCSNGCPASFAMDLYPDQLVRLAILGQKEQLLSCRTIWVCASCQTCTTRCPNGVRIAQFMDFLKELALREGVVLPQPDIAILHQTFLDNVRLTGRIFEGGLLPVYLMRTGQLNTMIEQLRVGWKLLQRNRLPLLPKMIRGKKEVREILRPSHGAGNES